jgi:hypothetical protein
MLEHRRTLKQPLVLESQISVKKPGIVGRQYSFDACRARLIEGRKNEMVVP